LVNKQFSITSVCKQFFATPREFEIRVNELLEKKQPVLNEELHFFNGRIVVRDYIPVWSRGRYRGHLWIYNDVTAKRQAEKKLLEQRLFYEEVLDKLPADVVVLDTSRRYLYVNPVAVRDPKVRQWLIGKTDEEYCRERHKPMEIAEKRSEKFREVLATRELQEWEETMVNIKGETEYHLRKLFPVIDEAGEVKLIIGYGMNITTQKIIEQHIQLSEKRHRDLFNYSQALICTHDMTGKLLTVNPEISRTLGYPKEEMVGLKIQEFLPEDQKSLFEENYIQVIREKNPVEGVFCIISKQGERLYLLYKNYRVEEAGAEPYVIGFSQNITERVKTEKELRIAKQVTEDIARAKESFLAQMSHEIRTPMNGVLGIASILGKTKLDEQQRNYIKIIKESANNLLVIVNDVLDLEKIIAGKLPLEKIPFRIVDKIATTVQSFLYKAEEKELGLIFQNFIPPQQIVIGDPYRLSQVLNNILGNALKFTERGHIKIATRIAETEGAEICVEVVVQDSGIGISEEYLTRIFEPFEQADTSVSRKFGGTGLGLSICKSLIDMQSGELLVQSMKGEGSTFTIRLPYTVSTERLEDEDEVPVADYRSMSGKKVLVAEDVELNQFLAKHILESWGASVDIANNGLEALELLQAKDYDCILMDVQMPEMDGINATQNIMKFSNRAKATIPIIALTANALKGDSEKYLEAGMNDYLAKPFDEAKLFQVIARNINTEIEQHNNAEINTIFNPSLPVMTNNQTTTGKLYDLSMVESVSGGDAGFIKKMIALFIETVPQNIRELVGSIQAQNWDQASKLAHKLKSTVDSMGINSLYEDIRLVESNAKRNENTELLYPVAVKIETVIQRCIEQLNADYMQEGN
jgi:PAS domain S-box-containing protein